MHYLENFQEEAHIFRTIVEASPFPVYLCIGEDLLVTVANEATLKAWGKTREVIGKPFHEILPELEDQPFRQLLLEVYHTGNSCSFTNQRVDINIDSALQTFYFTFSYQPFKDHTGIVKGVFCIASDVTDLVLAKDKLAASEESARLAIEAARLGTFDKNLVSGEMFRDARYRELFDIQGENSVTYEADFLQGLHPDDHERINDYLKKFTFVKEISDGDYDVEYRTIGAADKKIRWVRSRGKVFFDKKDTPIRFIGTVFDITDIKKAERQKNDFITIASHELKTPLTTIKSYVQLLLARAYKEDDTFKINALSRVERQTQNMSILIQNLLDNAKLVDGKLHMKIERFDIHILLTEIARDAQTLFHSHKIIMADSENMFVMADRKKITQVLENLINNAVKYSPVGSEIIIGCEKDGKNARISISDHGIGISKKDQTNIFDRFYRVQNEKVKNVSGFGIGLYLGAEILRLHESKIYVESKENEGSRFYFDLPITS